MLPLLHTFQVFEETIQEDSVNESATSIDLMLAFPLAVHVSKVPVLNNNHHIWIILKVHKHKVTNIQEYLHKYMHKYKHKSIVQAINASWAWEPKHKHDICVRHQICACPIFRTSLVPHIWKFTESYTDIVVSYISDNTGETYLCRVRCLCQCLWFIANNPSILTTIKKD